MSSIITINLGNNGAVVVIQKGERVQNKIFVKNLTAKTEQKLTSIFSEYKSYPIVVLLDTVAQNYVHKTFPAVNRFDLVSLVNRKFKQEIPSDDLKTKFLVNKEQDTGKWNFMFISALVVSPLKEWLSFFENLPNRVLGIYLVPLESKHLIKILSKKLEIKTKWTLLITQNKASDLRQVAFRFNELVFTRLLGYQDDEDFARKFSSDILRTIEYLKRISGNFKSEDLTIVTITESGIKEILANTEFKDIKMISKTPYDVANLLKVGQSMHESDQFCDVLLRNFFLKTKKHTTKFKTSSISISENLYLAKRGIAVGSVILMSILSLLFIYFFSYNITVKSKKQEFNQIIKSKEITLKEKKKEKFGESTVDIEQIANIGKIVSLIKEASINPLPIFEDIYSIRGDIFNVEELSWKLNDYPFKNLGVITDFSSSFKVKLLNPSGNIEDLFTLFDKFSSYTNQKFKGFMVNYSKLPTNIDFNSLYYSFIVDLNINGNKNNIPMLSTNTVKFIEDENNKNNNEKEKVNKK